jgi:hypothetical protein
MNQRIQIKILPVAEVLYLFYEYKISCFLTNARATKVHLSKTIKQWISAYNIKILPEAAPFLWVQDKLLSDQHQIHQGPSFQKNNLQDCKSNAKYSVDQYYHTRKWSYSLDTAKRWGLLNKPTYNMLLLL